VLRQPRLRAPLARLAEAGVGLGFGVASLFLYQMSLVAAFWLAPIA
jgi:hypothetical protein